MLFYKDYAKEFALKEASPKKLQLHCHLLPLEHFSSIGLSRCRPPARTVSGQLDFASMGSLQRHLRLERAPMFDSIFASMFDDMMN